MDFKAIALYAAIASWLFGLALVGAPVQTGAFYGAPAGDAGHTLLGRYFGSALLMYGAAVWGLRGVSEGTAQQAAAAAVAAATLVGLGVTLHAVGAGTMNALGWTSVALYGFFGSAWVRLAWTGGAAPGQTRRA